MAGLSYPSGDDYETPVSSLEDDAQENETASDAVAFSRRVSHASQNTPKPQLAKTFFHGIDSAEEISSPQIDELLKNGIKTVGEGEELYAFLQARQGELQKIGIADWILIHKYQKGKCTSSHVYGDTEHTDAPMYQQSVQPTKKHSEHILLFTKVPTNPQKQTQTTSDEVVRVMA